MKHVRELLKILSDGQFHSGEKLGEMLGVTRSAIWKVFKQLPALGVDLEGITRRGYRLNGPIELLDDVLIQSQLSIHAQASVSRLDVLESIGSTNDYLLNLAKSGVKKGQVCLAEHQSAGRGRLGRHWHSPYASNIYLSMLWQFEDDPASLSGLSLAVGVAIIRALKAYGIEGAGLKWPNDVLYQGQKLSGTLIELFGESHGHTNIVIGIGLNVAMPESAAPSTDVPWTDVASITGETPERNRLVALLLNELVDELDAFGRQGFAASLPDYREADVLCDQAVTMILPTGNVKGVVKGIGDHGELLFDGADGKAREFTHGEVSVRLA
jgi:BirA family transcriptional regulator, biotin operon repressor / biotin---[acetyl-CoA-carboxylase] ligase